MTLRVVAETNTLSVQKERVARGHGWTILPAVAVTQEIAQRTLSAAPLAPPGLRRTIVLAATGSRQASAPVRCVVGVLLDCVKARLRENHVRAGPLARRALAWLGGPARSYAFVRLVRLIGHPHGPDPSLRLFRFSSETRRACRPPVFYLPQGSTFGAASTHRDVYRYQSSVFTMPVSKVSVGCH
ncbi:LysR substrate-binding domain-containing protein [Burkholderia seminalis]|uniref:LysR substrate-binding domain-containing protein n=1 Tax=Burkholderia seminalis TaxID=488731 RepID=UPI002654464F|nr:LysR substrate-binding domain-containing protein [Burkholderia seminalis]MDN7852245.1 LysR substrate-binding domain-containing protein [Burkholderia seminalis]